MDNVYKVLKSVGVNEVAKKCEILEKHLDDVLKTNKKINLTAITDKNTAKLLHIEDSLVPIHYILGIFKDFKAETVNYADIGSGGGYPGIPIGVISGFNSTLIETTKKKADFLKSFINENNLDSIKVINDRIENVSKSHYECFDLISTRALASLPSLLELASPLCKIRGQLICYKAYDCREEIINAELIEEIFGFKKIYEEDFILSDNKTKRKIIAYKKIKSATIKLPRKLGIAQKRPYKIKPS